MTTFSYGGFYAASFPATTLTNASTFYPIVWDTVYPVNANITQNLSTNSLTVLVPGVYQVNSILSFQPTTSISTNYIDFALFQNGVAIPYMQARDSGFVGLYQTVTVSGLVFCAQNDTLSMQMSVNSAGYVITMLDGANFTVNLVRYILD